LAHVCLAFPELKQATLTIAKGIWNRYYAPVFNQRDIVLLAVYSHMIDGLLYLPDYPMGHPIAFQIEDQIRKAGSVGPDALLSAAARALEELQK
jgi:hypothetical protein